MAIFLDIIMTMESPATASWDLRISIADFAKLKRGISPRDMDDKWWIKFMTAQEVLDEEAANRAPAAATTTAKPSVEPEIMTEEELEADLAREEAEQNKPPLTNKELRLDEGGNISIRRSWFPKRELYRLRVKPNEDGTDAKIETIIWEQKQSRHISEEQAKIDIVLVCRQNMECEFAAAPDHDSILYSGFPLSWTEGRNLKK